MMIHGRACIIFGFDSRLDRSFPSCSCSIMYSASLEVHLQSHHFRGQLSLASSLLTVAHKVFKFVNQASPYTCSLLFDPNKNKPYYDPDRL